MTFRPVGEEPHLSPALSVLVRAETGETLGTLCAADGPERRWTPDDLHLLELAAQQVAVWHERSRLQQACKKSDDRYHSLVDTTGDMIFSHDMAGRFLSVNRATFDVTGYTPEELLQLNAADLVAPEFFDLLRQRAQARRAGHTGRSTAELEMITRDGGRVPVEVSTSLLLREGEPAIVHGIARDITGRRRMEEQLRQAQKLDAIGRLASGVAHDFNNVLAVINGYADLLLTAARQHDDPDPLLLEGLQQILKAGEGAARLTRQLLAFGRKAVVTRRELDLYLIVDEMSSLLQRLLGNGIEFRLTASPGLPPVLADRGQLEQVLLNLVVNARDAMPGGGLLEIRLTPHTDPDEAAPYTYVLLEVRDTGEGMDRATLDRLFEPFFTTKPTGKGTGLGLATVYGIVRQGGGRIEVTSTPGAGTRFQIYLPAAPLPVAVSSEVH